MGFVTSLFVRRVVDTAGAGVDRNTALRSVGIDPNSTTNPMTMISDIAYYDLLERIAGQIDVTDLPIRTGQTMNCDDYGAFGLAWKAAPTLRASFARAERYALLLSNIVEYEVRQDAGKYCFVLHRAGARRLGIRLSNEATLASVVSISRQVTTGEFVPSEVHFKHPAPKSIAAHERYFGCPVVFESDMDGFFIPPETLTRPNKLGDEGITQFLIRHLDAELVKLGPDKPLEDLVKDAVARSLSDGSPKMEDIARRLGMSVRTLHRRLAENKLNYQTLTETTRRQLAEGLLGDQRYSIAEIAFLTGFSEQSSFSRAFKKWLGCSPASYRRDTSLC